MTSSEGGNASQLLLKSLCRDAPHQEQICSQVFMVFTREESEAESPADLQFLGDVEFASVLESLFDLEETDSTKANAPVTK